MSHNMRRFTSGCWSSRRIAMLWPRTPHQSLRHCFDQRADFPGAMPPIPETALLSRKRVPSITRARNVKQQGQQPRKDHANQKKYQSWRKRVCPRPQITDKKGAGEPPEVSNRIDQSNRRGGSGLGEDRRGQGPEAGHERRGARSDDNHAQKGQGQMSARTNGHGQASRTKKQRKGGVPAPFGGSVGVPSVPNHSGQTGHIG